MVNRNIDDLFNATAYDNNGDKLGSVKEVYINDTSGQPEFVEVGHGLFGMSSSLVPLRGHQLAGEELRLAFTKDRISDAPDFDSDAHLSDEDQLVIYRHYGLEGTDNVENYGSDLRDHDRNVAGVAGAPVPGHGQEGVDSDRNTADAANATEADSLTLSEERLNVDKQRVETGQVRLRKYVVHDTETVEVPVEREEVRIERTPVDGTHADTLRGGVLEDDEAAMTVSEERVSVTKDTVPVEEVSLRKETVRDTETVSEDVAHEELDVDGAVDGEIDGNGEDGRHLRR